MTWPNATRRRGEKRIQKLTACVPFTVSPRRSCGCYTMIVCRIERKRVVKALVNLKSLKTYTRYARQHGRRFITQWVRESRTTIPPASYRPVPASWSDDQLTLAWIGHATVLINFYGTWLLTDPALRPRIGVSLAGVTFGPRRLVQPALA